MANKFHLVFQKANKQSFAQEVNVKSPGTAVRPLSCAFKHICLVLHSMSLCVTAEAILGLVNNPDLRIMWTEFLRKILTCVHKELFRRNFCSKSEDSDKHEETPRNGQWEPINVSQAFPPSEED
jgi:hypothetical protein